MLVTRTPRFITLGLTLFLIYMVSSGPAQGQDFTAIDVPGAFSTISSGITPAGDIVGFYFNSRGEHGFLLSKGAFTTIDVPGATFGTTASGINLEGDIVGFYSNATGTHGFLLSKGAFTTIDVPGATFGTTASGINPEGDIVGFYGNATGTHGFSAEQTQQPLLSCDNGLRFGINDKSQVAKRHDDGPQHPAIFGLTLLCRQFDAVCYATHY
jgi:uncharacterized membrane protein